MSAPTVSLDLSNTGEQIIQVDINKQDGSKTTHYVSPKAIVRVDLPLGPPYNFKLAKGRHVRHAKWALAGLKLLAEPLTNFALQ